VAIHCPEGLSSAKCEGGNTQSRSDVRSMQNYISPQLLCERETHIGSPTQV
jgi:hypothetical protein